MRPLPDILSLDDGARLTGVVLLPATHQVGAEGRMTVQMAVGTSEVGSVAGPAIARFMGRAVVVLYGVTASGEDWIAIFESVDDADPTTCLVTSRRALIRGFDLTGIGASDVRDHDFDWQDLQDLYDDAGVQSVDDWTMLDLLLGAVLNLTRGHLPGVVELLTNDQLHGPERADYRRHEVRRALAAWATQYDGPESDLA